MNFIRSALRSAGFDLIRYRPEEDVRVRRQLLMRTSGAAFVLDVGANRGEYGLNLRANGFEGVIHSFEPLGSAYALLETQVARDERWFAHHMGLGDADGARELHVSANPYASSLLDGTDALGDLAPGADMTGTETVMVRTLDSVWKELALPDGPGWMKVDTQGTELEILRGGEGHLSRIAYLELETSFVELYRGQPLFEEIHDWIRERGFRPVSFDTGPGQVDARTGEAFQVDVIYRGPAA